MVYNHWISGNLLLITHQEARYYIRNLRCTHKCSICPTYQLGLLNASQVRIPSCAARGKSYDFTGYWSAGVLSVRALRR